MREAYENQGDVQVLVVLLDIVRVILCRLLFVCRIEVETRVIVLYGFEIHSEDILDAVPLNGQRPAAQTT